MPYIKREEIQPSIDFIGAIPEVYTHKDFVKVHTLTLDKSSRLHNPCDHCGDGDTKYVVIELKDGNYLLMSKWSGCQTYSSGSTQYEIHPETVTAQHLEQLRLAPTRSSLYNLSLTQEERRVLGGFSLFKDLH